MLLTLSVSFANAQLRIAPITPSSRNLIDLTRGGFSPQQGLPPAYFKLIDQTFFDEAAHGVFELPGQPPQVRQSMDKYVWRLGWWHILLH